MLEPTSAEERRKDYDVVDLPAADDDDDEDDGSGGGGGGGDDVNNGGIITSISTSAPFPTSTTMTMTTRSMLTSNYIAVVLVRSGPGGAHNTFGFSLASAETGEKLVWAVVRGSAAAKSLKVKDLVRTINGKVAADMSHQEALDLIARSRTLNLEVDRGGRLETKETFPMLETRQPFPHLAESSFRQASTAPATSMDAAAAVLADSMMARILPAAVSISALSIRLKPEAFAGIARPLEAGVVSRGLGDRRPSVTVLAGTLHTIEVVLSRETASSSWGFAMGTAEDGRKVVYSTSPGSDAYILLKHADIILSIERTSVAKLRHEEVLALYANAGLTLTLELDRTNVGAATLARGATTDAATPSSSSGASNADVVFVADHTPDDDPLTVAAVNADVRPEVARESAYAVVDMSQKSTRKPKGKGATSAAASSGNPSFPASPNSLTSFSRSALKVSTSIKGRQWPPAPALPERKSSTRSSIKSTTSRGSFSMDEHVANELLAFATAPAPFDDDGSGAGGTIRGRKQSKVSSGSAYTTIEALDDDPISAALAGLVQAPDALNEQPRYGGNDDAVTAATHSMTGAHAAAAASMHGTSALAAAMGTLPAPPHVPSVPSSLLKSLSERLFTLFDDDLEGGNETTMSQEDVQLISDNVHLKLDAVAVKTLLSDSGISGRMSRNGGGGAAGWAAAEDLQDSVIVQAGRQDGCTLQQFMQLTMAAAAL